MGYEPVGYIIEYEICALLFLAVIIHRYFATRRFPSQKDSLFSLILWVTAADITLDIITSLIIDHIYSVPLFVTFLANSVFYLLQIVMPQLMTAYTLSLVEHLSWANLRRWLPLLLPGLALILLLLINPLTHWFFYVDPTAGYMHGPIFPFLYIFCFFYMIVTFSVAFRHRDTLRPHEFVTICRFLAAVLVSMLIQYMVPALLLSGVAMALAVVLMYFTLQNPETMLDATTGAFTYEAMLTFLHDRAQEHACVRFIAVQIHNVRRINELLGLENGSLLLRQVSQFLQASSKDIWVFRMRGSCFVAITRDSHNYETLSALLQQRISQPWLVGNTEVLLQATVCCVASEELPDQPISPEEAVNFLETAFLQGERPGRRVSTVTVNAKLVERIERSHAVEAALRVAIETGEGLELYFQPLWSVKEERFSSAEVLLRFHHPAMGFIPPDEFVPIAESNGLVTAMDELVLRKACAFIHDHDPRAKLGLDALEINLSALEFMHRRLPQLVDGITAQYRVDPAFLLFEITETAATESFELLKECMQKLCDRGCRFALDDFGTGYANISQVLELPFSMVKLDRTLLLGSEVVLEDLVRMFTRMKLLTVVEGVETAAQAAQVRAMQADYIQGYHYARPMAQGDFLTFLANRTGLCAGRL